MCGNSRTKKKPTNKYTQFQRKKATTTTTKKGINKKEKKIQ